MMKSGFWWVMIICIGIGFAGTVYAADDTGQEQTYSLGEIVVTGQHREVTTASNIYTIKAQDISDMGATTLTDVLELVPGVSIRVGGQGTPRVDIRGFRTRHVVLLLNGIPINDTYDGQFDPTVFPVDQIAAVKVITGGGSVLYGPGGNGGVINIITKKGTAGIQGQVGGEYGTEDAWLAKALVSGGTEKLDFLLSANRESKNAFPLSGDFKPTAEEDGGARENSDLKRKSLFGNMGYTFSESTRMGLTLNWYQGENGVPPTIGSDKEDPFYKNPKYVRIDDMEGLSSRLAFSHDLNNAFAFRGWAYRNQLDVLENRYDDATYSTQDAKGAYKDDTQTAITGVSGQLSYASSGWMGITLGLTSEDHHWEASGFEMVSSSGGGGGGGSSTTSVSKSRIESDENIDIRSIELEFELTPRNFYGFVLGIGQHFMSGNGVESDNDTAFTLGGHYDLSEETRLTASLTRKIRFPSLQQLYDPQNGNPDLGTEKTLQYEIGVKQQLPSDSSLSVSAYYSDVKDFIEKIGDSPYSNLEDYLFKGVDVSIETRYVENLVLRAAYSYLDSEDRSPGADRQELQYRPKNKYMLEGTYTFASGLMIHGDVTHVADQYFYTDTTPMLKRKLNDYTVVNAKISQRLLSDRMTLYVRAENVLDSNFEQSYDLPQAGRSVYGGVEVKF